MPPEAFMLQETLRALARQFEGKQLAQVQLSDATATLVYTNGSGVRAVVKAILLVNTGAAKATVEIYHDDNGTTYTNATIIWKGEVDAADNPPIYTCMLEGWIGMATPNGNLAVKSNQAGGDITVTVYGTETT